MNWFLVLLFWNPAIQEYVIADGWHPLPYATYALCNDRELFIEQYLPSKQNGTSLVDCIQAKDEATAIAIAKR